MANMNEYPRNGSAKKKGYFPRKSDRELENFFPETIKAGSSTVRDNNHGAGYSSSSQYSSDSKYTNSYSDQSSSYGKDQRNRGRRQDYKWAESKLYDDRNGSGFRYVQPKEKTQMPVATLNKNEFTKTRKVTSNTPMTISSETFQTSSSTLPSKVIMSHRDRSDEKKEKERITILKPNGFSMDTPPVILSRSKADVDKATSKPFVVNSNNIQRTSVSHISYTIATKPPVPNFSNAKVVPQKQMSRVFRLIDDEFNLCEGHSAFKAYLMGQPDFLVVGVIGRQGVGKSTVANIMARGHHGNSSDVIFPTTTTTTTSNTSSSSSGSASTGHTSTGLDLFVTSQRIIIMEFPAVVAPGVMDMTGRDATKHTTNAAAYQALPLEQQVQCKTLQFVTLALRVCHAVLLVDDTTAQIMDAIQALRRATWFEVRRLTPVVISKETDYADSSAAAAPEADSGPPPYLLPTTLVVRNKASLGPHQEERMQTYLCRLLGDECRNYKSGVSRPPRSQANIFTIPYLRGQDRREDVPEVAALWRAVAGVQRRKYGAVPYTEKTWFEYVVREWEKIRKSRLYLDYSPLFP